MRRSILIVRLSAMGDIVMATPLAGALRRTWPDARICWLVQPEWEPLLLGHPDIDEVLVWPRDQWAQLWKSGHWIALLREIRRFSRRMRACRFDLGIDAQALLKSAVLTWLCHPAQRVGLRSKERAHWLMHRVVEPDPDNSLIASEYLRLAQALELDTGGFRPRLQLGEGQAMALQRFRQQHGLESGFVCLCPFTTRPQKHWPEEHWSELLNSLLAASDNTMVLLGSQADRAAATAIIERSGFGHDARVINLAGMTTLEIAAGLVSVSRLVVAVDTGLGHIGIAFGRPTLLLFGSTRPYTVTTRDNARVLYDDLDCAPCRRHPTCNGAYTCMRNLAVQIVAGQALDLLASDRRAPR